MDQIGRLRAVIIKICRREAICQVVIIRQIGVLFGHFLIKPLMRLKFLPEYMSLVPYLAACKFNETLTIS